MVPSNSSTGSDPDGHDHDDHELATLMVMAIVTHGLRVACGLRDRGHFDPDPRGVGPSNRAVRLRRVCQNFFFIS